MVPVYQTLTMFCALSVISSRNPVYSVLFLIATFMCVSALLVCQSLDFFALTFIIVYVGAIAVLFLFVVMMINQTAARKYTPVFLPIASLFFIGILYQTQFILGRPTESPNGLEYIDWNLFVLPTSTIENIGQTLFTTYAPQFILASLILLVAMIGAIYLTMLKSPTIHRQNLQVQHMRLRNKTAQKVYRKIHIGFNGRSVQDEEELRPVNVEGRSEQELASLKPTWQPRPNRPVDEIRPTKTESAQKKMPPL